MASNIFTQEFKTKTILQPRQNPQTSNYWGISIDIGYSSVKTFSPNVIASFPSYAKQVEYGTADRSIGELEKTCIAYRDEHNNEFFVGAVAQDSVRVGDNDNSTASLYIKDRYFTPEFKAIARVGLALSMMRNQYGDPSGKTVHVQTGLPPAYMATDRDNLIDALAGEHKFFVKLGQRGWMEFAFVIERENVDVMPQPMGTLISVATDRNGGPTPEAKSYFASNLLIFDPGFKTLDTFTISNHYVEDAKTWDNLGMHRVLTETARVIKEQYDTVIPVPAMQKLLGEGVFKTRFDYKTRTSKTIEFAGLLNEANKRVCDEALNTLDGYYNFLQNVNYLVVTGGTGAAWYKMIQNHYAGIDGLRVLSGAANDTIPEIFSNVRGYYMNQLNTLKRRG